jgi:flagellin-like hook-associated protein FlgL
MDLSALIWLGVEVLKGIHERLGNLEGQMTGLRQQEQDLDTRLGQVGTQIGIIGGAVNTILEVVTSTKQTVTDLQAKLADVEGVDLTDENATLDENISALQGIQDQLASAGQVPGPAPTPEPPPAG